VDPLQLLVLLELEVLVEYVGPLSEILFTYILTNENKVFFNKLLPIHPWNIFQLFKVGKTLTAQ
jgi:hypothetical protein